MNKTIATVSRNSILAHTPCEPGLKAFEAKFGSLDPDTPVPLLACLESNSVLDVIWALRAVHQDISAIIPLIAADFAESVLHIFEESFPNDDRPRKAIEAARSGDRTATAADAAYAAAADAADAAKAADAAYAAYAAARAARAYAYAVDAYVSDAYVAAGVAADASTYAVSAASTTDDADNALQKQAEILRKYFTE